MKDAIKSQAMAQLDKVALMQMTGKQIERCGVFASSTWFNKDGTIKKKDLHNYWKGIEDSLFDAMREVNPDLDDSQVFIESARKHILYPGSASTITVTYTVIGE